MKNYGLFYQKIYQIINAIRLKNNIIFFLKYKRNLSYVVYNEQEEVVEAADYRHSNAFQQFFNYLKKQENKESELKR